jgi:hypothetical protein
MIIELEEERFYKTFEVEPQKLCFNGDCVAKDEIGYDEKICDDRCIYIEREYPEITDRKLLEIICILNSTNGTNCTIYESKNISDLKKEILNECMSISDDIELKTKIQQLFKEGE